ncbi:MAG TPA: hypothetical protein VGV67_12725, partial [Solirubrobacteraceae bacterium]|nr:hypothetical protein [Solirubrobacteraceae bacterium]
CGALLGLAGWAAVTQPVAVVAFRRLVRDAGTATWVAWAAAAASVAASIITGFALAAGSAGAGPVAARMGEVAAAGAWWPVGWAAWGTASLGLLGVLVLLADRARPSWRSVAVAVVVVAIAADLVADVLLAAALPVAAAAGERTLFVAIERSALMLSGLVANGAYGIVGLLLLRAGGRDLHPLVRVVGSIAFAAALASGVVLVALPSWLTPIVAVSISTFVAFAIGFGWQVAVSRRQQPALENAVRSAVRTLVPLHPVPFRTTVRDLAAVDLSVDADALAALLAPGLAPRRDDDGRALVTLLGGTAVGARPAVWPRMFGLPATPLITLRVELDEGDGAVTYLRGWADGTFTAASFHWLTELQLSRVDLRLRTGDGAWQAIGSAGSLRLALAARDDASGLRSTPMGMTRAVVSRGGRLAEVSLQSAPVEARPAEVVAMSVPFLDKLDARIVGAALLGTTVQRFGRARWR